MTQTSWEWIFPAVAEHPLQSNGYTSGLFKNKQHSFGHLKHCNSELFASQENTEKFYELLLTIEFDCILSNNILKITDFFVIVKTFFSIPSVLF